MRIVRRDTVKGRGVKMCQSKGVRDVPHSVDAHMFRITSLVDRRVSVKNLEKVLSSRGGQLRDTDPVTKVWMIEMGHDRPVQFHPLSFHSFQIILNGLDHTVAALGANQFANIRRVDMNRQGAEVIRYFFRLNHQELAWLLELATKFIERLQPHLDLPVFRHPSGDPIVPESDLVSRKRPGCSAFDRYLVGNPFLTLTQNVVIGERQEVITAALVPVANHFRKIIPIAPKRMRMHIAFVPLRALILTVGIAAQKHHAYCHQPAAEHLARRCSKISSIRNLTRGPLTDHGKHLQKPPSHADMS